jgi:hypothetical protein
MFSTYNTLEMQRELIADGVFIDLLMYKIKESFINA